MRRLLSSLTAIVLFLHALVGCCRQADCGLLGIGQGGHADSLTAAGCCQHDAALPCHDEERPFAPCQCTVECKGLCVTLPPEQTAIDVGRFLRCTGMVTVRSVAAISQATDSNAFSDAGAAFRPPEPPLRLHLLHQVILA